MYIDWYSLHILILRSVFFAPTPKPCTPGLFLVGFPSYILRLGQSYLHNSLCTFQYQVFCSCFGAALGHFDLANCFQCPDRTASVCFVVHFSSALAGGGL